MFRQTSRKLSICAMEGRLRQPSPARIAAGPNHERAHAPLPFIRSLARGRSERQRAVLDGGLAARLDPMKDPETFFSSPPWSEL